MKLPTLHLYFLGTPDPRYPPGPPRWVPGDQHARLFVRRLRGKQIEAMGSGLSMRARNLSLGLRKIRQPHVLHTDAAPPPRGVPVGIIHGPVDAIREIAARAPCLTGCGVLSAPEQWPDMFAETQAVFHLQASEWAADLFRRRWGPRVRVWPVGIDTDRWKPASRVEPVTDFLLYDKVLWDRSRTERDLVDPVRDVLRREGLTFETIRYGRYRPSELAAALRRCRAVLFLCEHETQGQACEQMLAAGLPVLAWDPGEWRDPVRARYGIPPTPATSVPYFDERCGERFPALGTFPESLGCFLENLRAGRYAPRDYVLENLTLERGARRYVELLGEALGSDVLR